MSDQSVYQLVEFKAPSLHKPLGRKFPERYVREVEAFLKSLTGEIPEEVLQ